MALVKVPPHARAAAAARGHRFAAYPQCSTDLAEEGVRERRYPRDRRSEGRRERSSAAPPAAPEVHRHRLYGDIPLVAEMTVGPDGKVHRWLRHDPDYTPPMPTGAVRGDVHKQAFCETCHVPKYFYVDEVRRCVQCHEQFVFRAAEQKYWYETLKFNFRAVPVRCLSCRRQRRSESALREQIAVARGQVLEAPSDPGGHLALARALVEYHQRTGLGDLAVAVAAARKAQRLWAEAADPLYWEGIAHVLAKRSTKGRQLLLAFLAHRGLRDGALKRTAESTIAELEREAGGRTRG